MREFYELLIFDIVKFVNKVKKKVYDKSYVEEVLRNMERMIKEDVKFDKVIYRLLFMIDMRNFVVFRLMDFGWKEFVNIRDFMF